MSSKIVLKNNRDAKLITDSMEVLQAVDEFLSFSDPAARFIPAFKQGIWDGTIRFMTKTGTFPIGLVQRVRKYIIKELSEECELVDNRDVPVFLLDIPTHVGDKELWSHQLSAVKKVFAKKVGGVPFPRGLIYAATNSGKSLIGAAICKALGNGITIPTLILVHRIEIFEQWYRWLRNGLGRGIGKYNSNVYDIRGVTVAMIPTLYARRKQEQTGILLDYFKCLIVDEVHHGSSKSWEWVITKSNAYFKIGLSGTALKLEPHRNVKLIGLFGPVLARITNKDMVDSGISAAPKVFMLKYRAKLLAERPRIAAMMSEVKTLQIALKKAEKTRSPARFGLESNLRNMQRILYQAIYKVGICISHKRAEKLLWIVKRHPSEQILTVVERKDHGHNLQHLLQEGGFDATFVCGDDSDSIRAHVLEEFVAGRLKRLIATMIYKEGIDVPAIDVLVMAMGGKSPVTVLQTFGRGLRRRPGKSSVPVYDFMDLTHPKLEEHSMERIAIYKEEKFDPTIIE